MILREKFGIIGGDLRQLYLAKKLRESGKEVLICGFENFEGLEKFDLKSSEIDSLILNSKYIIFPVPFTRNGKYLNAPFSSSDIEINEDFISKLKNKVVFGRIVAPMLEYVNKLNITNIDYYMREDFLIPNALLTAEGTVKLVLEECKKTIFRSEILVVGYGRIGKILSKLLKNMGADLCISARNEKDISWAKINGFKVTNINKIEENMHFDLVINTVPAPVLDEKVLNYLKSVNLIIDLASLPGGTDKEAAEKLGIKVINALGIPGKYFPESAGEIVANVINKIIREEKYE